MSRDMSEYIDDYCIDMYQHTNWAYMSTFSKEETARKKNDPLRSSRRVCAVLPHLLRTFLHRTKRTKTVQK